MNAVTAGVPGRIEQMALHNTLKNCTQCGHAAELHVQICPKCKKIFDESQAHLPEAAHPVDENLTPAQILANMEEKKQAQPPTSVIERTMSQAQADAISKEKAEFNKRFKDLFKND
jgi:hypothetical protein